MNECFHAKCKTSSGMRDFWELFVIDLLSITFRFGCRPPEASRPKPTRPRPKLTRPQPTRPRPGFSASRPNIPVMHHLNIDSQVVSALVLVHSNLKIDCNTSNFWNTIWQLIPVVLYEEQISRSNTRQAHLSFFRWNEFSCINGDELLFFNDSLGKYSRTWIYRKFTIELVNS